MKKGVIIGIIVTLMISLSACGLLRFDTDKIMIIEKQKQAEQSGQKSDNLSESDKNDASGTDLDDKGNVLQSDTEEYIKSILGSRAEEVITAVKNYDMDKLSTYVHPDKGVRLTPYGHVDIQKDLIIKADKLKEIGKESTKYIWGSYDGSGEPIELSFSQYYSKFIYDVDFENAEQVSYNRSLSKGNVIDNSREVYRNSVIVEYYFSGFDPKYEGMDWRSLKLVFEKQDNSWYLVGIIHGQWTI